MTLANILNLLFSVCSFPELYLEARTQLPSSQDIPRARGPCRDPGTISQLHEEQTSRAAQSTRARVRPSRAAGSGSFWKDILTFCCIY